MLRLVWEGNFFLNVSPAIVNRQLAPALLAELGEQIRMRFHGPEDPRLRASEWKKYLRPWSVSDGVPANVVVRHEIPYRATRPPADRFILYQAWEFGSVPKAWVHALDEGVDAIWTPSEYVRDCFVNDGAPPDRIQVLPHGIDPTLYHPDGPCLHLPEARDFRFLFVGTTTPRKGFDLLLTAYRNAFTPKDDVTLVIKIPPQLVNPGLEKVRTLVQSPAFPHVLLLEEDLPDLAMARLYRSVDSIVLPYRGEGFCLPGAEAMACGRVAILPNRGGALAYATTDCALLIPSRVLEGRTRQVEIFETVRDATYIEADVTELTRAMRRLYEDRDLGRLLGKKAAAWMHERHTWTRVARQVDTLITQAGW